jgi:N6-adenosine-specific RNA methylase IME4
MTRYRTIVADPPWDYGHQNLGRRTDEAGRVVMHGTGSVDSYARMSLAEIAALAVADMAEDDAHLYLWTTNTFLEATYPIARAWGFEPKSVLTWTKTHQGDASRVSMKTGYYFRGATEHCLFCVRGSLKLQTSEGLATGHLWPRLPHSVKPDAFYDLVEKASPRPYVELFARRARFGWDYWGDQSLGTAEVAA